VKDCLAIAQGQVQSDEEVTVAREYHEQTVRYIERFPTAVVPPCTGTEEEMSDALADVGLRVGTVTHTGEEDAGGVVVECAPAAGTEVDSGSAVDLVVSPDVDTPEVPACVGLTVAEATAVLEEAGLIVGTVTERPDEAQPEPGVVLECTPAPGTTVTPGSPVDLVVSAAPTPSPTPSTSPPAPPTD
jgi:serine/threonine-protein kinase